MNSEQKKFISRTARNIFLFALSGIIFFVFYKWIFFDWLSNHQEELWPVVFIYVVIVMGLVRDRTSIPTRAERHAAFNELMDDYPLLKMFYVVYAIAIVIGLIYVQFKHIYMVDVLDEIGFIGFAGAISLLGVPVGIARLLRSYQEAGEEIR